MLNKDALFAGIVIVSLVLAFGVLIILPVIVEQRTEPATLEQKQAALIDLAIRYRKVESQMVECKYYPLVKSNLRDQERSLVKKIKALAATIPSGYIPPSAELIVDNQVVGQFGHNAR